MIDKRMVFDSPKRQSSRVLNRLMKSSCSGHLPWMRFNSSQTATDIVRKMLEKNDVRFVTEKAIGHIANLGFDPCSEHVPSNGLSRETCSMNLEDDPCWRG